MDLNGRNVERLTTSHYGEYRPDWSPDGADLAFTVCPDEDTCGIYVMNADGTGRRSIIGKSKEYYSWPRFSPDGSRLVFRGWKDENDDIYVANIDGTDQKRLTFDEAPDVRPSWSPDGEKIAYCSKRGDYYQIFEMDADGSHQKQLTTGFENNRSPAYSPDGLKLVYHSVTGDFGNHSDATTEIYVMDLGTGETTQLTHFGKHAVDARWTPDGDRIVFTKWAHDGDAEVHIMNADGSDVANLTKNSSNDSYPAISPVLK